MSLTRTIARVIDWVIVVLLGVLCVSAWVEADITLAGVIFVVLANRLRIMALEER